VDVLSIDLNYDAVLGQLIQSSVERGFTAV